LCPINIHGYHGWVKCAAEPYLHILTYVTATDKDNAVVQTAAMRQTFGKFKFLNGMTPVYATENFICLNA